PPSTRRPWLVTAACGCSPSRRSPTWPRGCPRCRSATSRRCVTGSGPPATSAACCWASWNGSRATMLASELIRRKRDGGELSAEEVSELVAGIADESVSDAQVGALAMAIFLQGMTAAERVALTGAMTRSGEVLDWSDAGLAGPVLDKHSTGGVGDKVSLLLAPIVAACGGAVPMISGRGLGHTGGTLDKLESIPGYDVKPTPERFRQVVGSVGCAIIGQTGALAPADKRLYAIRDATGTV